MTAPDATRGPRRPGHGVRVGVRALVASISLLVIVAGGLAWTTYKGFTASVPHGYAVPALLTGERDPDGASENILLIGNDTRVGATRAQQTMLHVGHDDGTVNADTMMLLHIPADGYRPTLVSFPRDSWVSLPGFGVGKLNAAYPDGYNTALAHHATEREAESAGIIEVIKAIHALTGLYVDHYMQVDLFGFYKISEAIGGVTVCLNHAENKYTEVGDGGHGNSGIDLPAGVSVIKGAQALAFVRQRHGLPQGDLSRIRRQQYFLRAALYKIESGGVLLNPFKLHDLLKAVGGSLLTDPTLNLVSLADRLESVAAGHVSYETLPNNGAQVIYPDGVFTSIVAVDRAAIPSFIDRMEGHPDAALASVRAATPAATTVDVLNGTQVPRLAARNAAALEARGFRIDVVDSAPPTVHTTVEYPAADAAQAKAVLADVPHAQLLPTPEVHRVTLVLGTDGIEVRGLARSVATASSTPTPRVDRAPTAQQAHAALVRKQTHGLGCID